MVGGLLLDGVEQMCLIDLQTPRSASNQGIMTKKWNGQITGTLRSLERGR